MSSSLFSARPHVRDPISSQARNVVISGPAVALVDGESMYVLRHDVSAVKLPDWTLVTQLRLQ
jgi:hypothetical protein